MDVSNVVRVLLEKAANCDGYAAGAEREANRAQAKLNDAQHRVETNKDFAAEFRAAAETLQPGCHAEWEKKQIQTAAAAGHLSVGLFRADNQWMQN